MVSGEYFADAAPPTPTILYAREIRGQDSTLRQQFAARLAHRFRPLRRNMTKR